jgi:hypothetical protein
MLAAYAGRYDVCKVLLDNRADVTIATSNGKTAYVLAREAGYDEVITLLTEHHYTRTTGVGVNLRYNVAGSAISGSGHDSSGSYPEMGELNNTTNPKQPTSNAAAAPPPLPTKPPITTAVKSIISGVSGSQATDMRSAVSSKTRASGPVSLLIITLIINHVTKSVSTFIV